MHFKECRAGRLWRYEVMSFRNMKKILCNQSIFTHTLFILTPFPHSVHESPSPSHPQISHFCVRVECIPLTFPIPLLVPLRNFLYLEWCPFSFQNLYMCPCAMHTHTSKHTCTHVHTPSELCKCKPTYEKIFGVCLSESSLFCLT